LRSLIRCQKEIRRDEQVHSGYVALAAEIFDATDQRLGCRIREVTTSQGTCQFGVGGIERTPKELTMFERAAVLGVNGSHLPGGECQFAADARIQPPAESAWSALEADNSHDEHGQRDVH
jgi:hypothetical protein